MKMFPIDEGTIFVNNMQDKNKVLPGLEPGSKDSESLVITITLQDLKVLQEGLEPPTLGLLDPCSTN